MSRAKAYFFRESEYMRYDIVSNKVDVGATPIAREWSVQPGAMPLVGPKGFDRIDAAVNWGNGKVYFFRGSKYMRYDVLLDQVDIGPTPIAREWSSGPGQIPLFDRVDAAVNWGNGKVYFFKGSEYMRFDIASNQVDVGATPIAREWSVQPGAMPLVGPKGFDRIDAAVNWGNGKVYFFRGSQYMRFDIASDQVDVGATPIAREWNDLWSDSIDDALNWALTGFAGLDALQYPGNDAMDWLLHNTNLTWTGFYLAPAPSQRRGTSWMPPGNQQAVYDFLRDLGWGFAPIYVGQQTEASAPNASHRLNPEQGIADAADAAVLATTAGFPEGRNIFLDIEQGPPADPRMIAYYESWVDEIVNNSPYNPGVYCSHLLAAALFRIDPRPVFWVFNIGKFTCDRNNAVRKGLGLVTGSPFPNPPPAGSGVQFASLWQYAQGSQMCSLDAGGTQIPQVDFDSATINDPSTIPAEG